MFLLKTQKEILNESFFSKDTRLKKYYRLSELNEFFGFSDADIHYLNAETDISFCLYCKTTDVIIGGWKKGDFFGAGRANYSGLVSMTKHQQVKLFETKKVSVTSGLLLQKEKINRYSAQNPFKVVMPNTIISGWLSIPFEKIHFNEVPFHFYPEERKSMMKQFTGLLNQISTIQSVRTDTKQTSSLMGDVAIEDELFYNWKGFTLSDVCIIGSELEKAQSYLSSNTDVKVHPIITNKSNRPIDILILSVLEQFPDDKPTQIWNRLKIDVTKEPRSFDTDEILDEVGEDLLYWFDNQSEGKQMKKKSFYNLINKLKIN